MHIKLIEGRITQKSGFNFKNFVSLLDTNVKYALTMFLLKNIGLELKTEDSALCMELNNADKATKFYAWLQEKENYHKSINVGVVENFVGNVENIL